MARIELELEYGMIMFNCMVNGKPKGKTRRKFQWGGARPNSGPKPKPKDETKVKVCVSLDPTIYKRAVSHWPTPFSNLVEMLLDRYATNPIN